jgi:hypothetical protein
MIIGLSLIYYQKSAYIFRWFPEKISLRLEGLQLTLCGKMVQKKANLFDYSKNFLF